MSDKKSGNLINSKNVLSILEAAMPNIRYPVKANPNRWCFSLQLRLFHRNTNSISEGRVIMI